MKTIKILDLCCGEGGAAMGYHDAAQKAGHRVEITGIDIEHKKYYPFRLIVTDAVEYARQNAHRFDFVHASPPCQQYSKATHEQRAHGKTYPQLVEPIRSAMLASGRPGIIENVPFAPIRPDVKLWGYMFGLPVIRERWFELVGWWMLCPYRPMQVGTVDEGDYITIFGKVGYRNKAKHAVGWRPKCNQGTWLKTWQYAMGMPWVKSDVGISQAIPPAYTQYLFTEFLHQHQCEL